MEILVNELSLTGQFNSVAHFMESGLRPFIKTLNDIDFHSNLLLKKYDFYQAKITPNHSIYDTLKGDISRQFDEIRKFKLQLTRLFDNPYWEDSPKQIAKSVYSFQGNNVCGSSLAEACERDRMITSFLHNDFHFTQLSINRDGNAIKIDNLFEKGHYTQIAYQRNYISFDVYCKKTFSGSKLNFTEINSKEGFSLIKKEDEALFFDGFKKFTELSWQQIFINDALDYKKYNSNSYFKSIGEQICKFRISRKYRCFGYVRDNVFFVLQFDLEHKLSDEQ